MSPKQPKKKKRRYTSPDIKSVSERSLTRSRQRAFASEELSPCTAGGAPS